MDFPYKGETIPVSWLFRSLKSSGLDIENTHLQDVRRIEKLLFPIKKHGHRAKPVFKYGLEYIPNVRLNDEREWFKNVLMKIVM